MIKYGEEIAKNVSYNLLIAQDLCEAHYHILSIMYQSERIHRIKCKYGHGDKNMRLVGLFFNKIQMFVL